MQYNIYFDVAAIILNIILLLILFLRQPYPTKLSKLYQFMLFLNLVSSASDLISAYTISFSSEVPLVLNYVVNILYLASHNLTGVTFLLYVLILIRGNSGAPPERVLWIGTMVFELILILTTPITKGIFYFDKEGTYRHGPLLVLLYIAAFAVMFYALFLFLHYRSRLNTYQTVTNGVFLGLLMGAVIFQAMFPSVLIEPFCSTIALLMMNVALDNPAMYFYSDTMSFNRVAFQKTVKDAILQKETITILAFTFDDFAVIRKRLNNTAYETLVRDTCNALARLFGHKHVFYLSGGQFAIVDDDIPIESAVNRITGAVRELKFALDGAFRLMPHFCVARLPGFAETVGDVSESIETLLGDVFRETGNRVVYDNSDLLSARHRETHVVHMLRDAVRNDGFDVYFQPILDQKSGKFVSAEALVRMIASEGDHSRPDEFIPIAERNGMIFAVDEMVFAKVCEFIRANDLKALGIKYVEVNLSMLQLLQRSSAERLVAICREYGVPTDMINFEVTETASAGDGEKVSINRNIDYLREEGFTFSLDDYGSGYSTVTYLAEMPFQLVKIDRVILWNAMNHEDFRIILTNTLKLVRELGMKCIAEGVETEEMAELLRSLGCDYFQGYLYSKPIPGADLLDFLAKHVNDGEPDAANARLEEAAV